MRVWSIIFWVIFVILVSFYLNSRSVDGFHYEQKIFPKHSVCEQECRILRNSCGKTKLVCDTFARGKLTRGCKNMIDRPGESELYRCHLTTDPKGNPCMEQLTPENVKHPFYHLPEEGTCKQECYEMCQMVPPYTCKIECDTTVNDSVTLGCENLSGCIGESKPYHCKLKTVAGRQCMDKI
jgi:hypothetical protein